MTERLSQTALKTYSVACLTPLDARKADEQEGVDDAGQGVPERYDLVERDVHDVPGTDDGVVDAKAGAVPVWSDRRPGGQADAEALHGKVQNVLGRA